MNIFLAGGALIKTFWVPTVTVHQSVTADTLVQQTWPLLLLTHMDKPGYSSVARYDHLVFLFVLCTECPQNVSNT